MGDYKKYCKATKPGGGRIIACLSKSSDKLSAECKKSWLKQRKSKPRKWTASKPGNLPGFGAQVPRRSKVVCDDPRWAHAEIEMRP
jgi:hypothetical protein